MENIDIEVLPVTNSQLFDISFVDGDLKGVESMDTAIKLSIFEERRADESEQPVNELRRGWWGNELSDVEGFEIGSKLWELYQARATQETSNRAVTFLQGANSWFVEDNRLESVEITSQLVGSQITPRIDYIRSNNSVDSRSFKLWENTTP